MILIIVPAEVPSDCVAVGLPFALKPFLIWWCLAVTMLSTPAWRCEHDWLKSCPISQKAPHGVHPAFARKWWISTRQFSWKYFWRKQQVAFCPAFTVLHSKRALYHIHCVCYVLLSWKLHMFVIMEITDPRRGMPTWHESMSASFCFALKVTWPACSSSPFSTRGSEAHCKPVLGWITP